MNTRPTSSIASRAGGPSSRRSVRDICATNSGWFVPKWPAATSMRPSRPSRGAPIFLSPSRSSSQPPLFWPAGPPGMHVTSADMRAEAKSTSASSAAPLRRTVSTSHSGRPLYTPERYSRKVCSRPPKCGTSDGLAPGRRGKSWMNSESRSRWICPSRFVPPSATRREVGVRKRSSEQCTMPLVRCPSSSSQPGSRSRSVGGGLPSSFGQRSAMIRTSPISAELLRSQS
mmetsp:Transcript_25244/g.84022  ORF Transcript_25244/g.84022 Transcript_25244/m.84022 type:complete len:229 (+) Transcript_25244:652-1338(+)